MATLEIQAKERTYPVVVGANALPEMESWLSRQYATNILVVTDERIFRLHGEKLLQYLPIEAEVVTIPQGEEGKKLETYAFLMDQALAKGLDRSSVAIAFGGGAVGDVTGFFAATYMRGIPFLQVPTTILAHDSAIGGKVAINHPLAKNSIGAFYPPSGVFYETEFLQTLPGRERLSGFGEIMKHGWISSEALLQKIQRRISSADDLRTDSMEELLLLGMGVKKGIVERDEFENGERAYLNFGHTLGHAIENVSAYGTISHGEAITLGMTYALLLSGNSDNRLDELGKEYISYLKKVGYSGTILSTLSFDALWEAMKRDKKNALGKPKFVLLASVGQPMLQEIPYETAAASYELLCHLWNGEGTE